MLHGVDYSFARPWLNCLHDRGMRFVVRYLSAGNSAKNLTLDEKDSILNHGLKLVIVYQDGTSDPLRGRDEGVKDASAALRKANALGVPSDRPIYFALDQDPSGLTHSQKEAVRQYSHGAASVLGRNRIGLYGGYDAIESFCPNYFPWGWQTYAWSRGRISAKAHFRQYRNGVQFCGGEVDFNETYDIDFGQWPITTEQDWFDMATRDDLKEALEEVLRESPKTQSGFLAKSAESEALETVYYVAADLQSKIPMKIGSPLHETIKWFRAVDKLSIRAVVLNDSVLQGIPTVNP